MSTTESLLTYFREELNPAFEKELAELIEKEIDKELIVNNLLPIEVQREKKRQELLKVYNLEARELLFLQGLEALKRLYPTVLDIDEQKRFLEDISEALRKAEEHTDPNTPPFNPSSFALAAMWRVANVTYQNENLEDALAIYNAILTIDENLSGVLTSYAQCLQIAGRLEESISAFKRAAALEENNPSPLIGLTRSYTLQGHTEEAKQTVETLKALLERTGKTEEYSAALSLLSADLA